MKSILHIVFVSVLLVPFVTSAQTVDVGYVSTWINEIATLIGQLIPLLIAIAVLFFIWGLVTFIASADDEAARAAAKTKMIWGVVALFVIVGVWGLVGLLQTFTGIDDTTAASAGPEIPAIP
jgi:hypothetical protein